MRKDKQQEYAHPIASSILKLFVIYETNRWFLSQIAGELDG